MTSRTAPTAIAFTGRIDNRADLVAELGAAPDSGDAALCALAWRRWGSAAFARIVGPFAVILAEVHESRLVAARDALGDRTLHWARVGDALFLATDPLAVAQATGREIEVDDTTLACFFAVLAPGDGRSFFRGVRELRPGHVLEADQRGPREFRYWDPPRPGSLCHRSRADYAAHFRDALTEAVRCRLDGKGRAGVSMSGGLDSTAVAALAARCSRSEITCYSHVFDELRGCDERRWIGAVLEELGLRGVQVAGDDAWPLSDSGDDPATLAAPWYNPFRGLKERLYACAAQQGETVLLTGCFGDHLYDGAEYWLVDAWRHGCGLPALAGLLRPLRGDHDRVLRRAGTGVVGGRLLDALPAARRLRPRRPGRVPRWLTDDAAALVEGVLVPPARSPGEREVRARLENPLGAAAAASSSLELPWAARHGIDLRHPFRDRRLVELVLSFPTHVLFEPGLPKALSRRAMRGILPEAVRLRSQTTSLAPLFARGLAERARERARELLAAPDAPWRGFVRESSLRAFLARIGPGDDGIEPVVVWQCVAAALWLRALRASAPARDGAWSGESPRGGSGAPAAGRAALAGPAVPW